MGPKHLLLIVAGFLPGSLSAFDLSGTWHVSGLDLPGSTTQVKDAQGVLVGVSGGGSFNFIDGTLTISPSGAVSGNVELPVSGTATVNAEGIVSLAMTSPDVMTLNLPITTTSDLMATSHGETDYHEMVVLTKAPENAVLADVEGTWWVMEVGTPVDLGLQYNPQGKVIQVNHAMSFRQQRGSLAIDAGGHFSHNGGEQTGSVSVATDGTMTLHPDDDESSPVLQFHLNSLKDVMITAHGDSEGNELIILVKAHEVRNWEAAGHWTISSLNLPGSLPIDYDGNGQVTNISRLDSFKHRNGLIDFALDGSLSGQLESGFQGNTTSTSNGILPIFHGDPTPFTAAVNGGGDFFVGVDDGTEDLEMLVGVRPIRPLAVAMVPGAVPGVVWVPSPGRVLEESPDFVEWHPVPGSESTSSHTTDLISEGRQHFYRLTVP